MRLVLNLVLGSILAALSHGADQSQLTQQAYVWQRNWGKPLQDALHAHGRDLSELVILKAEVSWDRAQPHLVQVPVDWKTLAGLNMPIGLALRIGPFNGPFSTNDATINYIRELAQSLVFESQSNHVSPCELQIDFDCAESKLDGYRLWTQSIKRLISPVPVIITTLPTWLKQPAFKSLVSAAEGFVLQVHSLERPSHQAASFTLCDPALAIAAVKRASDFGVPFRVALPTYGYMLAFDSDGKFIGLSADGPRREWPPLSSLREVRSDPVAMASLVQYWQTNPPAGPISEPPPNRQSMLTGIIWYRFPVPTDTFNWQWKTLGAIVAARSPRQSLRAESRRVESGLVEIILENDGELDISSRLAIEVRWSSESGMRLPAGDGLGGFEMVDAESSMARFVSKAQHFRLAAGEKCVIGWLRFDRDREVQVETKFPADIMPLPK